MSSILWVVAFACSGKEDDSAGEADTDTDSDTDTDTVLIGCPDVAADPDVVQALPVILDTTWPTMTGKTIDVPAGGDLQAALDAAVGGDTIELEAGATFAGPFRLPVTTGTDWIVVRTSAPDSELPPRGARIDPSYASMMARITVGTDEGSALEAGPGVHHIRLVGLEVSPADGEFTYATIAFGGGESDVDDFPHDLVIDRCWVHGDPDAGARRGVALNSGATAIVGSYFSDFKEVGADSQAIGGWSGPGPYTILNNYLEGSGENVLFGGSDPELENVVPSDIAICGNEIAKPIAWRDLSWTEKNLVELKNARRALVAGNVITNSWSDGQVGFAILLTPRNQHGSAPWCTVEDVTIAYNYIAHSASGISLLGTDDAYTSLNQERIVIHDNVFEDIDGDAWNGDGRLLQIITPTDGEPVVSLKFDHNTVTEINGNGLLTMGDSGTVADGVWYTNNIVPHGDYGAFGSGKGVGTDSLDFYLEDYTFTANAIVAPTVAPRFYPKGNYFPDSMDDVGFVDFAGGDLRLDASSPYAGVGTDGRDLGADIDLLEAALEWYAP